MNFLEFRSAFIELGCVSNNQIYSSFPDFCANNLSRWCKQALLIKLRQGLYTFAELKGAPGFALYLSNKIYCPSYISLHTALSFYDIIPEAVTQFTSVSAMKTTSFENDFGCYTCQTLKKELVFGYDSKPFGDKSLLIATPEKAILDFLYLYPFYNTEEEIENLRFDEYFLANELSPARLDEYTERFNSKSLSKRVKLLKKVYEL